MKYVSTLIIAVLLLFASQLEAQISHGGTPYSFENPGLSEEIPEVQMPGFDLTTMKAEDEVLYSGKGQRYRFGKEFQVNYDMNNSGMWETLENGDRIWRLKVTSKEATSINLQYDDFYLPPGSDLFLYNADQSFVLGSFNSQNNKIYQKFASGLVKGPSTILEYYEPASVEGQGVISINMVVHAYRSFFDKQFKDYNDSGSCNNNVNCPESAGWEDQINSAALIFSGGFRFCSGGMVNNTDNDGTPYFLTANHCGDNNFNNSLSAGEISTIESTWMFMFNYQSASCSNSDGPTNQTVSGGTVRAHGGDSDFLLIELSSNPPEDYNVFLAGWDRVDVAASSVVSIHHPSGDIKKITFDNDPVTSDIGFGAPNNTHWRIGAWSDGTTEGGSSGSPLFNQNGHVIGDLTGGAASCNNIDYDIYGKLAYSWDQNGAADDKQLQPWLDPGNTGATAIDGTYGAEPEFALDGGVSNVVVSDEASTCTTTFTPMFTLKNFGANMMTSASVTYTLDGVNPQVYNWNGNLASFASETINLPTITVGVGNHTFLASLTSINGNSSDENDDNNASSQDFEVINGTGVMVSITTDNYADETTYEIEDANGTVIATGNGFTNATTFDDDYCLGEGCYTFTIFDSASDGICCGWGEGFYSVSNEDGELYGDGGEFAGEDQVDFCIEAQGPPAPVAAMGADQTSGCGNVTIAFSDQSLNNPTAWTWTFEGGQPANSSSATPSVTYNAPGTYNVTLTVSNDAGSNNITLTNYITVNELPEVTFDVISSDAQFPGSITAIPGAGVALPLTYDWSTGWDQATMDSAPAGDYTLSVTDANGCTKDFNVSVTDANTGLEDRPEAIGIYPNPANSFIIIDKEILGSYQVEIYDVSGKLMQVQTQQGTTERLDLNDSIISGIYFVQITTEAGKFIEKLYVDR